jgi:hypothetical protein
METSTAAFNGDGDIATTGATGQNGGARIMPAQEKRAAKSNCVNWLRLTRTQARNRNERKHPWHWNQACASPPELTWWRKDLRSIPKVFLIDACEVS